MHSSPDRPLTKCQLVRPLMALHHNATEPIEYAPSWICYFVNDTKTRIGKHSFAAHIPLFVGFSEAAFLIKAIYLACIRMHPFYSIKPFTYAF